MKRKLVCLLLACFSLCIARAESIPITLILTNGQTVSMSFAQKPRIKHKSGIIEVTYGSQSMEINESQLSRIILGDATSVDTPSEQECGYVLTQESVKLHGQTPESEVSVYAQDGSLLKSYKTDADGNLEITLSDFTQKVLVLKTDSFSFKVLVK